MSADAAAPPPAARAARDPNGHAPTFPFGKYERMLAIRYLFATRKDGGVALMSVIAFVGVMLAVMALISVMAIMNGFRHELLSRMLGIDGHIYVQVHNEALTAEEAASVADIVRGLPGVTNAYPLIVDQALATGPLGEGLAVVRGMRAEDIAAVPFLRDSLMLGGDEEFGQGPSGGDVIYAGRGLAQPLGVGVGDDMTLMIPRGAQTIMGQTPRSKAYMVGDYIDTGLEDYNRLLVYMPLEQAQLYFNRRGLADQVEVRLTDPDMVGLLRGEVQRALGARYLVTDWRDRNQALFNALQVERGAMRLILMLVVVIAALNIISGFIMLVRNKSRDIAILRTVGMHRGSVLRIFLMSGAMLGVLGTLAGVLAAIVFCTYIGPIQGALEAVIGVELFSADVYGLDHLPARIDWAEVVFVAFWSFLVSVLVTLVPAWFAARLDPVEGLRYE